ncbi:MAG: hypothetical protein BGO41_07895 [Clostridiales bacterium 38-18]|nr:MAG: hypothetical protein BGO41_07895 [Clostridiales bacterium 38-18]
MVQWIQIVVISIIVILIIYSPYEYLVLRQNKVLGSTSTISAALLVVLFNLSTSNRDFSSASVTIIIFLVTFIFSTIKQAGVFARSFEIPSFEGENLERLIVHFSEQLRMPNAAVEMTYEGKEYKIKYENVDYHVVINVKRFFFEDAYYYTLTFKKRFPRELQKAILNLTQEYIEHRNEIKKHWRTRIIQTVSITCVLVGLLIFVNYNALHPKYTNAIDSFDANNRLTIEKIVAGDSEADYLVINDSEKVQMVLNGIKDISIWKRDKAFFDEISSRLQYLIRLDDSPVALYIGEYDVIGFYDYQRLYDEGGVYGKVMVSLYRLYGKDEGYYFDALSSLYGDDGNVYDFISKWL